MLMSTIKMNINFCFYNFILTVLFKLTRFFSFKLHSIMYWGGGIYDRKLLNEPTKAKY